MFWIRRKIGVESPTSHVVDELKDPVLDAIKRKTHNAADDATRNATTLNELFRKDGITFNIHIASNGREKWLQKQ